MRPTSLLSGASRLTLTPKRGNKDFYKGTGQSRTPGGGPRTGPPGRHVIGGTAKYRVEDDRVRYFVGPGIEKIEASTLKPYVTTTIAATKSASLPSFSPMPPKTEGSIAQRGRDAAKWTKLYRALPLSDKNALIMDARRKWYDALAERFPAGRDEEGLARALEARADGAPARS